MNLGFAQLDIDRERRQGLPEIIYGTGKTAGQIEAIVRVLLERNTGPILVTRVDAEAAQHLVSAVPGARYEPDARLLVWRPAAATSFHLVVVTAGTADQQVAEETAAVAHAIGLSVESIYDVGVAGLHRLLAQIPRLRDADAVVVVAGMEGALASAVGGLVASPVVAVPTSTGYGAALDGVTALLAMLSSCAAGITVVNIDSGFGAAMAAHRLAIAVARR